MKQYTKTYNQYSSKQKFYGLCLTLLLLVILASIFSFRKTYQEYNRYSQYKSFRKAGNLPSEINLYKEQIKELKKDFSQINYNKELIFTEVNTFCREHNLIVKNYFPEEEETFKDFTLITTVIEVQGAFKNMVELVYLLEQEKRLGHISSTKYTTVKDKRTKKENLLATLYLQNIIQ